MIVALRSCIRSLWTTSLSVSISYGQKLKPSKMGGDPFAGCPYRKPKVADVTVRIG
jgi:hypothetical protein